MGCQRSTGTGGNKALLTPCGLAAYSFLPLSPLTPVPSTGPSLLPVSSLPSLLLKGTPENLIAFPGGACPAPGRRPFRVALAHGGLILQCHVRQAWTGHLGSAWRQSASWVSAPSVHSQPLLPSSGDRGQPARAHWASCQPRALGGVSSGPGQPSQTWQGQGCNS